MNFMMILPVKNIYFIFTSFAFGHRYENIVFQILGCHCCEENRNFCTLYLATFKILFKCFCFFFYKIVQTTADMSSKT